MNNKIDITDIFKILVNINKAMNVEFLYLSTHNIYGLDINMSGIFKICDINPLNIYNIVLSSQDITDLDKIYKKSKDVVYLKQNNMGITIECSGISIYSCEMPYNYKLQFNNNKNIISSVLTFPVIHLIDNMKENEEFVNILDSKAADGVGMVRIGKYYMTLFKGLIRVNKPDKVMLKIYNLDSVSFISNFIVDKKKFNIYHYIRFRYESE